MVSVGGRYHKAVVLVGLTGGIGAGKSSVAAELVAHGARLIDADVLARSVLASGGAGLPALRAEFGAGVFAADGSLDRARLAAVVFADEDARARLNAIVHPLVAARTAELVAQLPDDAVVVHDVPLLVENNMAARYDVVVVVEAPLPVRLARLSARGMSESDARARIASQASDEERRAVATALIDNDGSPAELHRRVVELWREHIGPLQSAG